MHWLGKLLQCVDILNFFYSNSDGAVIPSLGAGAAVLDMILAEYI